MKNLTCYQLSGKPNHGCGADVLLHYEKCMENQWKIFKKSVGKFITNGQRTSLVHFSVKLTNEKINSL